MGGAIIFLTLFPQNYIHWQQHNVSRSCDPCIKSSAKSQFYVSFLASKVNDVTRKLYSVEIHSTVKKPAKRTPDIIVKITAIHKLLP